MRVCHENEGKSMYLLHSFSQNRNWKRERAGNKKNFFPALAEAAPPSLPLSLLPFRKWNQAEKKRERYNSQETQDEMENQILDSVFLKRTLHSIYYFYYCYHSVCAKLMCVVSEGGCSWRREEEDSFVVLLYAAIIAPSSHSSVLLRTAQHMHVLKRGEGREICQFC